MLSVYVALAIFAVRHHLPDVFYYHLFIAYILATFWSVIGVGQRRQRSGLFQHSKWLSVELSLGADCEGHDDSNLRCWKANAARSPLGVRWMFLGNVMIGN